MARNALPSDIESEILLPLPVKTLMRFRSVCKRWKTLFSDTRFVKSHLEKQSKTVVVQSRDVTYLEDALTFYSPSSIILDSPYPLFPAYLHKMLVVGSCNGVVCFCTDPWDNTVTLWNPAMRHSTLLRWRKFQKFQSEVHSFVSIGLCFDSQADDYDNYFVLGLLSYKGRTHPDELGIFSTKSATWTKLVNTLGIHVLNRCCDVIVKGIPFWKAVLKDDRYDWFRDVYVFFDTGRKEFDWISVSGVPGGDRACLIDFKDNLGLSIWHGNKNTVEVWVRDNDVGWTKTYLVEPIVIFD